MDEDAVRAAVGRWARRIGPCSVFDHDDARQEARLALLIAGERGHKTLAYNRIIDAMRALIPGFYQRSPLFKGGHLDPDESLVDDGLTPEQHLHAKQMLAVLDGLPEPARSDVYATLIEHKSLVEIGRQRNRTSMAIHKQLEVAHRAMLRAQQPAY